MFNLGICDHRLNLICVHFPSHDKEHQTKMAFFPRIASNILGQRGPYEDGGQLLIRKIRKAQ